MKEFLEFIARHLVDDPGSIYVSEQECEGRLLFTLAVRGPDIGKVIGRQGRTAQALRVLLSAVAAKNGRRARLDITG